LSEFEKLKVVTKYELLKQFRRKRFYGVLAITIIALVLTIGLYKGLNLPGKMQQTIIDQRLENLRRQLPENMPEEMRENILEQAWEGLLAQLEQAGIRDSADFFAVWVTSMGTLAILGAVFFGGDSIASEFEHKTGYVLFPNPVKRITLVVGKYLACFIATAVILVISYLISTGALLGFYRQVPVGILGSLAIALMLSCCVISMAFAFSSVLKGGMGATIATLLTFMIISPIISSALSYAGYDPWFMPDRGADAIAATYGVSFEEAFGGMYGGGAMMGGMMRASQDPTLSFLVLLAYAVVLFQVSLWMTNRREMT
jgi:ABC-2 type transport system permease protein